MNRWVAAGAIGMAGLAALIAGFPRVDPYAFEPIAIGRREALQRAMRLSARYGVETAGWRVAITGGTNERLLRYHRLYPDDPNARGLTAFQWDIALRPPNGPGSVRVVLYANGAPKEWEWKEAPGPSPVKSMASPDPETVLRDFSANAARPLPGRTDEGGVEIRSWEWRAGNRFPLTAVLDITRRNGRLISAVQTMRFDDSFESSSPAVGQAVTGFLSALAIIAVLAVAIFVFFKSARKNLTTRVAPVLTAPLVAWSAWQSFGGQDFQRMVYQGVQGNGNQNGIVGLVIGALFPILGMLIFAGAAYGLRSPANRARWLAVESMVGGAVASRPVGSAVAAGIAVALGIAAIPYIIGMPATRGSMLFHDAAALSASMPQGELLDFSPAILQVAAFGFLWPLLARMRTRPLRYALLGVGGILLAGISRPILFDHISLNLIAGCLTFLACLFLYVQFGLLAPMAAACAAQSIRLAAVLITQPESSLHAAGLQICTALAGAGTVAAVVAWRGRDVALSPESEAPEVVPLVASDRARLDAEFDVARRAQEAALPPVPPAFGDFAFAASCVPAQQVGGDLYDFFPLPGGRLGVAVGDVSGKGVPAALYMMMTRGLLSAGSRNTGDLGYLLGQVNLHLYRTCKRKIFVTMAAVALDPAGGLCLYGRAGHNPVIWRRTGQGESVLLKSRGLGLGMVGAEAFARSLEIRQLELEPGDALVLYSDGVTEAVNASMEQFGEGRLLRSVDRTDGRSAEEGQSMILRDVAQFMGATPPRDDITVVFVRVGQAAKVGDADRELV